MAGFEFETFMSVGPSPEQLKEEVKKSDFHEIISYGGGVYAIRYGELRNLGLDNHDAIVKMCRTRGLEDPAFFARACMYCSNSSTNIGDLVSQDLARGGDGVLILNRVPETECGYKSQDGIRVATTFTGKNQEPFYAVEDNCAFTDALVRGLADNGVLEPYAIQGFPFDFKPIASFPFGQKIPDEYLARNVSDRLNGVLPAEQKRPVGLLRKLGNLFSFGS